MSLNVIAIGGKSLSGKDTVARMILDSLPGQAVSMAFADRAKATCMELYGLPREAFYTEEGKTAPTDHTCWLCPSCGSIDCFDEIADRARRVVCRACTMVGQPSAFESRWTPRMIVQHVAEAAKRVDPCVWVTPTMRAAALGLSEGVDVLDAAGSAIAGARFTPALVVISDLRFRVEKQAVERLGGVVWRLRRPSTDGKGARAGIVGHVSESELDGIADVEFDRVIHNDGSLDLLRSRVEDAVRLFMSRP